MNRKYAKMVEGNPAFAPDTLIVDGNLVTNPNEAMYLAAGWKRFSDAYPTEPAGEGKHWEADGWDETESDIVRKWKAVDNPKVYRKFSKLKIYGTISMLPPTNDTTAWQKVQTWLEGKEVNGINGWMAFQLAQEISEDHPLFEAWAEEARVLLGLTPEQFETLLNACVLEGAA